MLVFIENILLNSFVPEDVENLISKIHINSIELDEDIVGLREKYQYGIELSMKKELFNESLNLARKLLGRVKEGLEE